MTATPHPVDSTTRPCCQGIGNHAQGCTASDHGQLTDLGPAPAPPAWCAPGATPSADSVDPEGTLLWSWVRDIGKVWIACADHVIGGRIMRSAPEICVGELRLTVEQARVIAAELGQAAGAIAFWAER